jgi:hypothetical protein
MPLLRWNVRLLLRRVLRSATWFCEASEPLARVGNGAESKVEPHLKGEVIAFPYFENGDVVAEKYRARGKAFSQRRLADRACPGRQSSGTGSRCY